MLIGFTDLHSHSFYSRRDRIYLERHIQRAKEIGYRKQYLTDTVLSGLASHYISINNR